MQRAFLVFHRGVALVANFVLIVLAFSGSAIVFEGAIDRALNPQLRHVDAVGPLLSLDTLVAHARAHAPGVSASLVLLVITASGVVIHYDALGEAIGRLDKTKSPGVVL